MKPVSPRSIAYRQAAAEGRPLNYGFATSWALARMEIVAGLDLASNFDFLGSLADPAFQQRASATQISAI